MMFEGCFEYGWVFEVVVWNVALRVILRVVLSVV